MRHLTGDIALAFRCASTALHSAANASIPVERYIETAARECEWPTKAEMRKRTELREFLEVRGDRPIDAYRQEDGVKRRLASHP